MPYVLASQTLWGHLQAANQNVLLVQNVHRTKHVSVKGVQTHAKEHVDNMLDVKL